jgi:hypothetical protein
MLALPFGSLIHCSKDGEASDEKKEPEELEMQAVNKTLRAPLNLKLQSFGNIHLLNAEAMQTSISVLDALDARDKHTQVLIFLFVCYLYT